MVVSFMVRSFLFASVVVSWDRAAPPISSVGIPVRRRRRRPGLSEQVRHPLADVVAEREEDE
jgi:hypothetical protein